MGRGCADSLECQEFPIIIPLPSKQHKHRTPGMGKSHGPGEKILDQDTLDSSGVSGWTLPYVPAHPKIITPKPGSHLPQDTHLHPHRNPEFHGFTPKSWSSNSAVTPPKKHPNLFSTSYLLFPNPLSPRNAIPCQKLELYRSALSPAEFLDFGQGTGTSKTQPQQQPPTKATEVGGPGQGLAALTTSLFSHHQREQI